MPLKLNVGICQNSAKTRSLLLFGDGRDLIAVAWLTIMPTLIGAFDDSSQDACGRALSQIPGLGVRQFEFLTRSRRKLQCTLAFRASVPTNERFAERVSETSGPREAHTSSTDVQFGAPPAGDQKPDRALQFVKLRGLCRQPETMQVLSSQHYDWQNLVGKVNPV